MVRNCFRWWTAGLLAAMGAATGCNVPGAFPGNCASTGWRAGFEIGTPSVVGTTAIMQPGPTGSTPLPLAAAVPAQLAMTPPAEAVPLPITGGRPRLGLRIAEPDPCDVAEMCRKLQLIERRLDDLAVQLPMPRALPKGQ